MSKRKRTGAENKKIEDVPSTKRTRYELQHERDYFSLPQYDKPACRHKYHLRSFEHRKPVNYYSYSSLAANAYVSLQNRNHPAATNPNAVADIARRNAHSYSINGHAKRFSSNSSSISSRKRTLEALKKEPVPSVAKKRKQVAEQKEDVSSSLAVINGFASLCGKARFLF